MKHSSRILSAVGYIGILFLVPLLFARKDEFAQFHAKQGFVMFIAHVIVGFFAWIPFFGWLAFITAIGFSIYAGLQALHGNRWQIPYIGKYAEKLEF